MIATTQRYQNDGCCNLRKFVGVQVHASVYLSPWCKHKFAEEGNIWRFLSGLMKVLGIE